MIIYLLMCIYFIYTAAEGYNDSAFNESQSNYQHIWHSYIFNTGAGNREELHFSHVELNNNFESVSGVFTWKNLQLETQDVIVGLGNDFLLITTVKGKSNLSTFRYEIQGPAKALAVFQKWDVKTQKIEGFIIVSRRSNKEGYTLMWYKILHGKLEFLWDWQYRGNIAHLHVIKINHDSKLLIINEKSTVHKNPSAEIYSFHVNDELDVWLFERLILIGSPSSVAVFDSNENVFFCASFPHLETIHIFRYSKSVCVDTLEKKHFVYHQKIFSIGLKSITPFQVGFHWHLAVASWSSLIYYIGDNLMFQPVSNLSLGNFNNWLVIPVDTYRGDPVLLADSASDVSAVAWTGDRDIRVIGSFTRLGCGDDVVCSEKIRRAALNESTAFTCNGRQNIVMSAENGTSLFLQLFIRLKPLPDKTMLKLKDILNEKNFLKQNYTSQNQRINRLLSNREENSSKVESVFFSEQTFETKPDVEAVAQTKAQQEEFLTELNGLKATVELLNADVKKFMAGLKSISSEHGGQSSKFAFLTRNATDGITFFGDVLINELKLASINGYPVNELFKNTFRKNKAKKIGGKKALKRLNVENVVFEKLGGTSACDIVFSDDPWESKNKNVLNGDVIWDNKLAILNDVKILKEGTNRNPFSVKIPRGTLKPVYDSLNFKELEITDDFHVQKNINGQPIILPVHGGRLNILDIVNQARFEVVNVKQNLDVELVNGKNYSLFMENIIRGTSQLKFDSVVVDGAFSAASIQADRLNDIDLPSSVQVPDSDADKVSDNLLANDADAYETENNLKSNQKENLKRVIHVFEDVEINGILFSKKINNFSWVVLNDTVKKNEEAVNLIGTKTFEKSLRTKKATLSGTFNGRFIEHIMTDFSDQILRYPQVFDNVKFKNLSLEGAWDSTYINQLNESLVKFTFNNGQESNLTFENDCFMNVLNVMNVLNNVSVNSYRAYKPENGKIELKSVKASHVIVHGSLITNNKINNINITNFNMLRVSLKNPETVNQDIYHYNLSVSGNLNVETLNFNDMLSIINSGGDTNLTENFMNGEIHNIKKLLVKGNISTLHGINGFNLPRIFEKGMRITKPGSIKGNVTFDNILYFNNINVTNSIDGFSLKNLEKDIAFKHSQVFLTGAKNFSIVKVTKSMRVRTLNGHLMEEVMSLNGDHSVRGPVQINGDVIVRGNVTSYSAINNITVTDLLKTYSTRFNSYIYSGDLNLSNDQVTIRNLTVGGKIQNIYLDALVGDSVRKEEDGIKGLLNVSGRTTFKGEVKFNENVVVEEVIHGVNFSKVYSDLTFINKPTRLGGIVTIQESVLKDLETTAHFNSTLINNIDTNDWLEDCVCLDKSEVVSGKKIFEQAHSLQDISVDFINGHLPSAMISLKKNQYIPTLALFPRIHSTSDLSVEGFVNGKNLQNEYRDSVLINGPQTVRGKKIFDGEFVVNGTLMVESIKGKSVNSLVTLDTEQVIKTPLKFTGLVMAKQNVENLKIINNISLSDWNERSVVLNRNQVLNGTWTVKGKVKTKNIEGQGLLYSVNLPNISKDILKGRLTALEIKNATELEYSAQCRKVDELSRQFSRLPYLLHQFEVTCEIETSSVIDSVITFKISNADHLIITFENECLSLLYLWNKGSATFDHRSQINIGPVSKWLAVGHDKATYLVTSSQSNIICEEKLQRGNIWMFKEDSDGYDHLLTTNAFLDITRENVTSDEFFTIDENGILQQWTLKNGNISFRSLRKLDPDNYRFIDFRILGGLAVSNGREVKRIILENDEVIQPSLPFSNTHLVALPVDGEVLTALVLKDKIVIYKNLLEEKIYAVIDAHKADSVLWFNYGPEKQAFLIVGSHHKLIEVYEYKSVSGLVKKMSIQMFSNRLQSADLPVKEKYQYDKFIIVIQKKKLAFVRAEMFGDYFQKSDSLC